MAGFTPDQIDTTQPHPARMYNYYLGGKDNYPVDKAAAAQVIQRAPEAPLIAKANRAFLGRAVRYLAAECGIRQFLDIGTGIPTAGNVHEVAGKTAPGTRVAYVDNDPIVHTHANALLTGGGNTGTVLADLRDPEAILAHPVTKRLIDFTQPVGLLLIAVLHFITNEENPAQILATLRDALPDGSYLALSHVTGDFRAEAARNAAEVYNTATSPAVLRTREEVAALFGGWDLIDPGLVQAPLWRPDGPVPRHLDKHWIYAGAARLGGTPVPSPGTQPAAG